MVGNTDLKASMVFSGVVEVITTISGHLECASIATKKHVTKEGSHEVHMDSFPWCTWPYPAGM